VNSIREAVESFESIADKYMHLNASKDLLEWIAACLTDTSESVKVTSYQDRLITYLTGPEIFNVLMIGLDGRPKSEKTIRLRPYITKNYSCDSLHELHHIIRCTKYELWNIVQDVEKDISKVRCS
jgi:hypothetical protein